ncbi:MAG: hypothetical protein JXA03_11210 [Bacteroidales bacterium]|nr:hypothetical protein [Bacteroidales bacterium]
MNKHFTKIIAGALLFLFSGILCPGEMIAQKNKNLKGETRNDTLKSSLLSGLKFRSIGPAFTSGRISDFAVNPLNHSEYYVAVASGHIWKTKNNGITFNSVFDNYGSYSIGCLAMDPHNPNVVWAGSGENNHQRSVSYGDGVYKTTDGGKSWKNMGLKDSRQIGMIAIDPRNTEVVYVAAEGSVWGPGGDRGLYKTSDGGTTWEKILNISENTGVNNILIHPDNPDLLFATSEQRRRHVFTKIGGGPETAVYKSTDGGKNWRKLTSGLPGGDMGGIGLAISPQNTNVVYAIIEAEEGKSGFFRSEDLGESWSKMSDYHSSGQYYNEIYCDPLVFDKVFSLETVSQYTLDGGKTWKPVGNNDRHVDDHAMWIDPADNTHYMIGGDGGVYETFDNGKNWLHKTNLPVVQFYRVNVDNTEPFYWVYGGTQDNSSFGGPSQTLFSDGCTSCEWVVTLGGDGFWQAIDPDNPDIVYSAYQYGNIYRYDKKSGERINIKPQPRKDEDTYKWNWNAPFILSPHSGSRIYLAANKVFRSDDRGQSWQVISDDITAQIDRNTWPVMGRFWGVDAVVKDVSTSLFGTAVSIAESPVKEGLLYVGADDGVIQVTEDNGANWRKISSFPGVPENTYVSDIFCSRYDENTVFASFDNRKRDDFKPYLLKSTDKGNTWVPINGNLPENWTVHCIIQDHVNSALLFAGTEFGVFTSIDAGKIWTQLKAGIPTISVRDIAIQERENDLVLATFGRGFYILDNYSPLREINPELLEKESHIFNIKTALMYMQKSRGGYGSGSNVYKADNPPFGAVFTYYLKESPKTLKQERKEREKDLVKEKKPIPIPTMDELRAEKNEVTPHLIFTITDAGGDEVRKVITGADEGIHRINWDLRYTGTGPVVADNGKFDPMSDGGSGFLALPGKYFIKMSLFHRGGVKDLAGPVEFMAETLNNTTLPAQDRKEMDLFLQDLAELHRIMRGTYSFAKDMQKRIVSAKQAAQQTPAAKPELITEIAALETRLDNIMWQFDGQQPKASDEENLPAYVPLNERLNSIAWTHWRSTSGITQTQRDVYAIIEQEFPPVLEELKSIYNTELPAVETKLEDIKAPWTPGRVPEWKKE